MSFSFRNQDIISHLVKLLSAAVREIVGTEDENDHDGINMIDIAEGCTGALQNMAKDRESRELIRNMNIIPAVCDLMCIDHQEKVLNCLTRTKIVSAVGSDQLGYYVFNGILLFDVGMSTQLENIYKNHHIYFCVDFFVPLRDLEPFSENLKTLIRIYKEPQLDFYARCLLIE